MKKIVFILGAVFLLAGCVATQSNSSSDITQEESSFDEITEKIGSIRATVRDIQRKNNQTIIKVSLDNHLYDLSGMNVMGLSVFSGVKPIDYQIENTLMGGHHITAHITFPGELSGSLIIGLREDLMFNFDLS